MATINTKNIGYTFAGNLVNNEKLAGDILTAYPDVITEVPKEVEQDIKAGMKQRFIENNPKYNQVYGYINGSYLALDKDQQGKHKGEKVQMSVGFATAETQQAFGQLRTKNKPLFDIMQPVRNACNNYVNKTYKKFISLIKEVYNERMNIVVERKPTEAFDTFAKETLMLLRKRCINAKARGDVTADEARLERAGKAFLKEWNS
jgi:hypothetical protein